MKIWMARLCWSWTVLALFAAAVLWWKGSPHPPRIQFSQQRLDFGAAPAGSSQNGRVRIRNIGQQRLDLLDIKSSCGCTVARCSDRFLEPGEFSDLEISFVPAATFTSSAVVRVVSNDPVSREALLHLSSRLPARLFLSPKWISTSVSALEQDPNVALVHWNDPELYDHESSLEISTSSSDVMAELKFDFTQRRASIVLQATQDLPTGRNRRTLSISERSGRILDVVECEIRKPSSQFDDVPRRVIVHGSQNPVVHINKKVQTPGSCVRQIKCVSSSSLNDSVPFDVTFLEDASGVDVTLQPTSNVRQGAWHGHLFVETCATSTPESGIFSVPVVWLVKQ